MTTDAELDTDSLSATAKAGEPSEIGDSPVVIRLGSEAAPAAAAPDTAATEKSAAPGTQDEGQTKALVAGLVAPSVEPAKIPLALERGADDQAGTSPVAVAPPDPAAVDPLEQALAALDRRDYSTAQRLFEALGRKGNAAAIGDALAALDRKDYATAQRLFDAFGREGAAFAQGKGLALAISTPPKPALSTSAPKTPDFHSKAQRSPATPPLEVVPLVDRAYRRPLPAAESTRGRGLARLLVAASLALAAILGASVIYGSPLNWNFAAGKNEAITVFASAVGVLKAPLEAIKGPSAEERSQLRDLSAALTQVTIRLDQMEHDYGARLEKLGERVDQDSSYRFTDIVARLDRLEKKSAMPPAPAPEIADVAARLDKLERRPAVAAAPTSEIADIAARVDRLEKRVAVATAPAAQVAEGGARWSDKADKRAAPGASSAKPLAPAVQKPATLLARAEPAAPNENARPLDTPRGLLRDYRVEDVRDGVAVIDSRYGAQQVAPGDFIPGAGRVLRFERQGGDWFVLTNLGVIASDPELY